MLAEFAQLYHATLQADGHGEGRPMFAAPVETAVLLQYGQRTRLDGGVRKTEPEVQLQRPRRGRLDAAVLVLRVEEEVRRMVLGGVGAYMPATNLEASRLPVTQSWPRLRRLPETAGGHSGQTYLKW